MPSDNTVQIIIFVVIIVVVMYYLMGSSEPIPNEGPLQYRENGENEINYTVDNESFESNDSHNGESTDASMHSDDSSVDGASEDISNDMSSDDSSVSNIIYRSTGPNNTANTDNKYKQRSYNQLNSGSSANVDKIFNVDDVLANRPDDFGASHDDPLGADAAPIKVTTTKKQEEQHKYDINQFTPKEKRKDWFEVIDSIDVKNSQLINIYRPIGANTIGSSLKCAALDIRGNVPCPQTVVSPWLQSSIQPDNNLKSLC